MIRAFYILFCCTFAWGQSEKVDFPVDNAMRIRVDFWKKVYTEITSGQGFLHDTDFLDVVYETVNINGLSRRARRQRVKKKKSELKARLASIAKKKKQNLTEVETKLLKTIGERTESEIRQMSRRVRFQQGLKDRYEKGLYRSYLYLDKIKSIILKQKLPIELAFLPHVESSFNYRAYSKVGAAGIWQFMRATARLYGLRVNYAVDERRDPIRATEAAVSFLRDNYRRLKTWPLALTAYNHGAASMARAVRTVNSRDMSEIIAKYNGRRFGFASKNFYATFMATVEISKEPEVYFGKIRKVDPVDYSELVLPQRLTVNQIAEALEVETGVLRGYNPALRNAAFRSYVFIPRKFKIKLPPQELTKLSSFEKKLAAIEVKPSDLKSVGTHTVARGESLYVISKMYRVALSDLIVVNQISAPSKIRPGMKLKIPGKGEAVQIASVKREPKPAPKVEVRDVAVAQNLAPVMVKPPLKVEQTSSDEQPPVWSVSFVEKFVKGFAKRTKKMEVTQKPSSSEPRREPTMSGDLYVRRVAYNSYELNVEAEETLGHYADWAGIGTQEIRRFNRKRYGQSIRIGEKIVIPLTEQHVVDFQRKRIEFHLGIEEDFYSNYKLVGTQTYVVKLGDTLASLTRELDVPLWLLKKYQNDNPTMKLFVGQRITLPLIEPRPQ